MPHPFSMEVKQCPYPHYDRWRDEGPVTWNEEMGAWLALGYKEAVFVLDNHLVFSSTNSVFAPEAEDVVGFPSMINIDEPRHRKLRALAAKAFTPKSIDRDWAPRIKRIVDEQLDGAAPDTFNVIGDLAYPLPVRMIAEIIGVESDKFPQFKSWSDEIAKRIGMPRGERGPPDADEGPGGPAISLGLYFFQQVALRVQEPRDDLLTRLLQAEVDGERLNPWELQAFLILLLVAGNETTTNLIGTAIRALAEDAALMERVRADRGLVWNLIEESLRYDAPIQGFYRKARQDIELAGQQIKAGDPLCVLYGAGNRDPKEFECPAEFRVDAARRDHLAFGKGIHYCLGANLARIEAEIAINAVLDRFETVTPKPGYEPQWRRTPFFRGMVEYECDYTLVPPDGARVGQ
jgi:cytochrome P450